MTESSGFREQEPALRVVELTESWVRDPEIRRDALMGGSGGGGGGGCSSSSSGSALGGIVSSLASVVASARPSVAAEAAQLRSTPQQPES
jgi:hypothetical protein